MRCKGEATERSYGYQCLFLRQMMNVRRSRRFSPDLLSCPSIDNNKGRIHDLQKCAFLYAKGWDHVPGSYNRKTSSQLDINISVFASIFLMILQELLRPNTIFMVTRAPWIPPVHQSMPESSRVLRLSDHSLAYFSSLPWMHVAKTPWWFRCPPTQRGEA